MQVSIRYEVVVDGEQDTDSFVSHEDGLDPFADGILALLWARAEFENRWGQGARVLSVDVTVKECEPDRVADRTPGRPPGGPLAEPWRGPGPHLAE